MQDTKETWVRSLSQGDHLEEEMATQSSVLAWKTPWTEEPGGLQSMQSQRVRHDWAHTHTQYQEIQVLYGCLPLGRRLGILEPGSSSASHWRDKRHFVQEWISYIKEQHCQHNWYDKTGLYQNVNFCIVLAATHTHTLSFFSNGQYHSISECALWDVSSKCASKKLSKEFQKKKCILLLQTQQIY